MANHFERKGHDIVVLSRALRKNATFRTVCWDATTIGPWKAELEGCDALINLAGKSVDCRYTQTNKHAILQSRIESTSVLGGAVSSLAHKPKVWINASSATIYNSSFDQLQTEYSQDIGSDFSMSVCQAWEKEFARFSFPETRSVVARIAITLSNNGGAFVPLERLALCGMGGPQGSGRQRVSWIHITDFCRSMEWIVERPHLEGIFNICSPSPVSNAELMSILRKNLGVPFGIPLPALALDIGARIIRTEPELILKSRNVYPKRLVDNGFTFRFPDLATAVRDLLAQDAQLK